MNVQTYDRVPPTRERNQAETNETYGAPTRTAGLSQLTTNDAGRSGDV